MTCDQSAREKLIEQIEPFYDPDMESFGIVNLANFILDRERELVEALEKIASYCGRCDAPSETHQVLRDILRECKQALNSAGGKA